MAEIQFAKAYNVPVVTGQALLWEDVEVGMLTSHGLVLGMDRRYTNDGGVKVTLGGSAPRIQYDTESVFVYGKVA